MRFNSNIMEQQINKIVCSSFKVITNKMAVISMIVLLTGYVNCGMIVNPPADTTGVIGSTVQFECEVTFHQIKNMAWEFDDYTIYSFLGGVEDYPSGSNKYSVTIAGSIFILSIEDLTYDDGGIYTCSSTIYSKTANLLALGTPSLTFHPPSPVEGDYVVYTCEAQFGGPSKDHISLEHYPKLWMFFTGGDNEEEHSDIEVENQGSYHHLCKQYNVSVDASMNGKELACEIRTSHPVMNVSIFIETNILYSVRNTTYKPYQDQYQIGSTLTCMADGNPLPSFDWENVAQPGKQIYGKVLNITESMIGQNMWRCTSTNIIDNVPYKNSTMVVFTAIPPTDYEEGVGFPIYVSIIGASLGILCVLGISICWCKKKLWKPNATHQASRANDASRTSYIPLLRIPVEHRRLASFHCMKTIEEMKTKEDLDEHGVQILQELEANGKTIIGDFPKILFEILQKANSLIESNYFIDMVKAISEIYSNISYKPQDGALDTMIEIFTKGERGNLFNNQERLLELCREILPTDKCHNCRATFLNTLIRNSEYITDSQFYIKWTKDYIKTLKHLLINGADSRWAPGNQQGISEKYTAQYLFFGVLPNILLYNNDLFDDLMDIILSFISQASSSATYLEGSPLHALVESTCTYLYVESLQPQQSQQPQQPPSEVLKKYVEIVSKVVEVDRALVDKTDSSGRTPLQQFVKFVKWNADFLEDIKEIVSLLKSNASINGKDRNGWTVMHCLAEAFPVFYKPVSSEDLGIFVGIVKQLKSNHNSNIQDVDGRTALHVLAEKCNSEILKNCVLPYGECLRLFSTKQNILAQDKHKCTALHILVRGVAVNPDVASEMLSILQTFITHENVNVIDEQSTTPFSWILKGKYGHQEPAKTFSEIIKMFKKEGANVSTAHKGYNFIDKYLRSYRQTIATKHGSRLIGLDDYISIPQRYKYLHAQWSNLGQVISLQGLLDELAANYVITCDQKQKILGGPQKSEGEQMTDLLNLVMKIPEKAKYLAFLEVLSEDYEDHVNTLTGGSWRC